MKIIIFTNYFPPELGAASSRIYNLAKGLQQEGHNLEVVAPLPNYPKGEIFEEYKGSFRKNETIDGIKVNRFWIYATVSKKAIQRLFGMLSFAITLWFGIFSYLKKKPDVVIIQHSPLLVSFSAMLLSKLLPRCKRVLNVSDLWPLSALELGAMKKGIFYSLLEKIELFNYKNAHLILGQSNEILQHVNERCNKPLFLYRNISPVGNSKQSVKEKGKNGALRIVYAGLLGVAQGVYDICQHVDFKKLNVEFHIYGGGNEEKQISDFIKNNPACNIFYHGSLPKDELLKILPTFHASIVPLASRIYGAVPSKIYELITYSVPIIFCGGGEGAKIIEENNLGYTSEPGDFEALESNIKKLAGLSTSGYNELIENCVSMAQRKLNFQKQIEDLNQELIKFANK